MLHILRSIAARLRTAKSHLFAHSKSLFAVGVKINGAVLSFLVTFILARVSGAVVTGYYAMALVTLNMVVTVAIMGLDLIVVRIIAGELRVGRPDLAWAGLRDVMRLVGAASLVLSVMLFVLAGYAPEIGVDPGTIRTIAPAVFGSAMLRIAVVALRAKGSILFSQFLDSAHNFTLVIGLAAYLFLTNMGFISSTTVALFYTASVYLSMFIAWTDFFRRTKGWERGAINEHPLVGASWKILVTSSCISLTGWVNLALLGALLGSAEVGAFRVATQIIMTIQIMTATLSNISAPQIAAHFRVKDLDGAWRVYRQTAMLMILAASLPSAACLLLPELLLEIFGPEFTVAASALMIMALGQIVSAAVGPMGTMTVMSGNETLSMRIAISFLIIAAILTAILTPLLGLVGTAIAGSAATIGRSLTTVAILRRRLKNYASSAS